MHRPKDNTFYIRTKGLLVTAASRHFLRGAGQMLYLDLAKNGRLAAERYGQLYDTTNNIYYSDSFHLQL